MSYKCEMKSKGREEVISYRYENQNADKFCSRVYITPKYVHKILLSLNEFREFVTVLSK